MHPRQSQRLKLRRIVCAVLPAYNAAVTSSSGAPMNKNRVELFSDGVFAIVLTLLVLHS